MKKVKPNSIEAVVLFILYICLQDGKITNKEVKELAITAPVLQKMYFDIFGEFIHLDLDRIINDTFDKDYKYHLKLFNKHFSIKRNISSFLSILLINTFQ